MKLPKELKQYVNRRRSQDGKKNGVVKWLFEGRKIERMICKNKRDKS